MPAANTDPGVGPSLPVGVESGEFVLPNLSMVATLVLALESYGYDAETTSPTITTPGHGLVHLSNAVYPTTWSSLLTLGCTIKRGLRQHQPPQQQSPSHNDRTPPPQTEGLAPTPASK